jgi:hypothetical protein
VHNRLLAIQTSPAINRLGSSAAFLTTGVKTFVGPTSESIDKWQQLSTIQFLEGQHGTPRSLMDALETTMKTRCPGHTDWRVIFEEPHSVTYEWRIHSCTGQDNQTEIARILQGNDGLHRIAYTEKGDSMKPENREFWMKVLNKAYVAKGDPTHPVVLKSQ